LRAVYPDGIHETIADALADDHEVRTATLDEPDHGLTDEVLESTDVLLWWGHEAHDEVSDAVVDRVCERVLEGMGFIPLHSSHYAKPFKRLMGTACSLQYREGRRHRAALGRRSRTSDRGRTGRSDRTPQDGDVRRAVRRPRTRPAGVRQLVRGGEVFRSGCCYRRGNGRIFYFRPGHETYPIYENEAVRRVLRNAVAWASPTTGSPRSFGERE